jgi:ribosomal protein S18 acetylase RimI-like enzyme
MDMRYEIRALKDHARQYAGQAGGRYIFIGVIHENKRLLEWYRATAL